jgi:hypothetical protein
VKLDAMVARLPDMKIRLIKIMKSPFFIVQKIDAIKTFVLPSLDFALLNDDVREQPSLMIDKYIKGLIDKTLKVRGLLVECHHAFQL